MSESVFDDKAVIPTNEALESALGPEYYEKWNEIESFVKACYPKTEPEWKYPGKKFGWSFRLKDKKRVIVYLLPREGYFLTAHVFGKEAFEEVMNSGASDRIKTDLAAATPYAEGRGIRADMRTESIEDIKELISIKLKH